MTHEPRSTPPYMKPSSPVMQILQTPYAMIPSRILAMAHVTRSMYVAMAYVIGSHHICTGTVSRRTHGYTRHTTPKRSAHICVSLYICIHIQRYIHIPTYTMLVCHARRRSEIHIHICVYVCMYIYIYARVYACVCMCMHVYACVCTCMKIQARPSGKSLVTEKSEKFEA